MAHFPSLDKLAILFWVQRQSCLKDQQKEKRKSKEFGIPRYRSIVPKEEKIHPYESRVYTIPSILTSLQHLIVYRKYVWPCLQLVINYDGLHVFKINYGT